MAEKRICLCCGKTYDYCPNCGKSKTPWKINYDTEACKDLFNIVSAYNMNLVKEEEIKQVLNQYSITDYSVFKDSIRNLLNKLFRNTQSIKTNVEPIPVVFTEKPVQEIVEEVVEEIPTTEEIKIEETPRNSRRRNRFFE